jgi:DNA-binding MarR family transcriptional regulator/GNAT superfamily N-acetyltransferase
MSTPSTSTRAVIPESVPPERIAAVRRFNRFHTRLVGALNEGLLASPYPLPQVRVLYEVAHDEGVFATDLARRLNINPGHLSRLLSSLEAAGLVSRAPSADNGKRLALRLTDKGRETFAGLNAASAREVADLLSPLSEPDQRQLVGAMETIERLLGKPSEDTTFVLRDPVPGDMGWIVHRQATLYTHEYGWDWTFEALVSRIVSDFITNFDPDRERCWVAEREGEIVGSVFVVRQDDDVAKLRMLYVEQSARGLGLGRRLVDECLRFARAKGYKRLVLWTNANLVAARRIYETAGFRLIEEEPHHSFGHDLIGQIWERDL